MSGWLEDARDLLCDLIAVPSVNPMDGPISDTRQGEAAMAVRLAALLEDWGLRTELRFVEPERPNLLAYLPHKAPPDAPLILLDAHTDTVAVGERVDLLVPRVEGTRVIGRGACDVKGPMTATLLALRELARAGGTAHCRVVFAATMGEEYDLRGARDVVHEGLAPDAAIVAEPTSLEIVRAHKGVVRWRIESHGVAGHGSDPASGHNAIHAMARLLVALETEYPETYAGRRHPLLGAPSFNVGVIEGGLQYNIIPDRCAISLERRLLPGESVDEIEEGLRAFVEAVAAERPDDLFMVTRKSVLETLETPAGHPLVDGLARALSERGRDPVVRGALWTANSGVYNACGVPSVVFGPGETALAHTVDEWIDLVEVVEAAHILVAFLHRPRPS